MPFRVAKPRALCAACSTLAEGECRRCRAPLCHAHTPSRRRRCDACEAAYLKRESDRVRVVVVSLIAFAALIGLIGAVGTHMARNGMLRGEWVFAVPLIPALAAGLFAAVFASPPLIRWLTRRGFLAERRP